ncbi:hypothetical protein GCM10023084_75000 [Streptomyces lacrimifluminis]|uniref:Uncharacterized protein n=1 Tax=Streptomyces lacrimifluminis TaxID=1500077 RepID=A0A917P7D3_9ACTN|nr:hypothetical protein GCM10012282_73080 [Streptomyces lacrimifluminis]
MLPPVLGPGGAPASYDGRPAGSAAAAGYRYLAGEHGARTAAGVSYSPAASAAYARLVVRGLKAEGYHVVTEQVDFALPNFRAEAADLREQGAGLVFDYEGTEQAAVREFREAIEELGSRS